MESVKERLCVHIRWMIRADMGAVLQIESASFGEWAWAEEDFLRALRDNHVIGMVTEVGGKVVGFMLYGLEKRRLELLNLAVDPAFRRRGVGSQMTAKLAGKLSPHGRPWIAANVGEWNTDAQLFFKACGFEATGVSRRFFEDRDQDAYRFTYAVDGHDEEEDEFAVDVGGEAG